jgi:hypothetical protein
MFSTTPSFVDVKIILEIDGTGQYDDVYIIVHQTQSIFDCLVDQFDGSQCWTKLHYRENGVLYWSHIPHVPLVLVMFFASIKLNNKSIPFDLRGIVG